MVALPPAAMAALAIGSTVVQAIGQISQGNAQAAASNYNARVADNQATSARLRAAEEERRIERDNRLRLGAFAAQRKGVTAEGSFLDVTADAAAEGELRKLDARYGGLQEARYYQQQAALDRQQARQARRGGLFGAAGTLIGGAMSYGRTFLGNAASSSSFGFTQAQQSYAAGVRGRTPF